MCRLKSTSVYCKVSTNIIIIIIIVIVKCIIINNVIIVLINIAWKNQS